jgi:hypothetical protein
MVGQPKKNAMIDALEDRKRDYYHDEPEGYTRTTLDYVSAWIADGHTLKQLAFEIGTKLGYEVGRERISVYLRDTFGAAEVGESFANARVRASYSLVEDALELVDAPADDTVEVSRAAQRAKARQWTAERYNQRELGTQKGVTVNITPGSLHLDALRSVPARATAIVTPSPEQPLLAPPITDEK